MSILTKLSAQLGPSRVDWAKHLESPLVHAGLLSIVIVVSAVLRFYKLGEWSFWGDEYTTVTRAIGLFEGGVTFGSISRMATYLTMSVWGISEWSARLPAAVFGVLTVPVLYFLVKKAFDPLAGLLASALLAISPWHIYWSQNARFYTPLLLFFTVGLFYFYFFVEEDRLLYLFISAAFLGLALNERLIAAFLVPIVLGFVVGLKLFRFETPPSLRRTRLILFGVACAIVLLLLLLVQPNVVNLDTMAATFRFVNNNPLWIVAGVTFYIGLPLVCAAATGGYYLLRRKSRAALLLAIAATLPLVAIMAVSLVQYAANRYIFVALTSVIVLGAVGVKELLWHAPKGLRALAAGFALMLLLGPMTDNFLYFRYQNGNRDNWKDAFALITALKSGDDRVVTMQRPLADYYVGERTEAMQAIDAQDYGQDQRRIWFIIDLTTADNAPEAYRWILANAQLVANFDVTVSARTYPMRVYLYDPERPPIARVETDSWAGLYLQAY